MLTGTEFPRILDFALTHRLATVFEGIRSLPLGGLLKYGPDTTRMHGSRQVMSSRS
jgi:hypothetical protein